jgi:hypothetical protein
MIGNIDDGRAAVRRVARPTLLDELLAVAVRPRRGGIRQGVVESVNRLFPDNEFEVVDVLAIDDHGWEVTGDDVLPLVGGLAGGHLRLVGDVPGEADVDLKSGGLSDDVGDRRLLDDLPARGRGDVEGEGGRLGGFGGGRRQRERGDVDDLGRLPLHEEGGGGRRLEVAIGGRTDGPRRVLDFEFLARCDRTVEADPEIGVAGARDLRRGRHGDQRQAVTGHELTRFQFLDPRDGRRRPIPSTLRGVLPVHGDHLSVLGLGMGSVL